MICISIKDHISLKRCMSDLIPFKWAGENFWNLCNQRQPPLGAMFSSKEKKNLEKNESLWSAVSAVNKHTSDEIANLTSSCYTYTDLLPFSRHCPSVTSALISVFIFVTWAWCKWNLRRLAVHDPCPNQEQLISGRYCSSGGGSWGTFGDQMLSILSAPSPRLNAL